MLQAYEAEGMEAHSSLPGRYLQDEDVALDFGAYYELFRKYEDDYKVVDILDGRADAAIEKQASEARFDERVALVGLLLDAMLRRVKAMNPPSLCAPISSRWRNLMAFAIA